MGSCGAVNMTPEAIMNWVHAVRKETPNAPFLINLWIPHAPIPRDTAAEERMRAYLERVGPRVPLTAADTALPDFHQQCHAILQAQPAAISSIMGLFPPEYIAQAHQRGIKYFATATTVQEALDAERAGADAIVVQGMEAGGHRGAFDEATAETALVGLFALLPTVVDAVRVPVIAAGGIADARGVAAALLMGASAVHVGTGFLRCPEAGLPAVWADALSHTAPEDTILSRGFSGRAGRSIATAYARAVVTGAAPRPCAYPVQRGLTQAMRDDAVRTGSLAGMQAWAGQAACLASSESATTLTRRLWTDAVKLLRDCAS